MFRSLFISSVVFLGSVDQATAQTGAGPATVSVSVNAGGKSYEGTGAGSCRHAPDAAIYNVPAALWMVEQAGGPDAKVKEFHLTLWRPKNGGPEQLSLNLTTGSGSHRIDVGGRGEQVGSGKVTLSPSGEGGGRFEVKGKDQAGSPLEVVIECSAFSGVEAEGG